MRFILVDDIVELHPGQTIQAVKTLGPEEELFRDHFPGFPVVPGVLLTEMMGQAAAQCLIAEDITTKNTARGRPMLAQIKSATFRDWVRPGETVTLIAEISANRAQFATAQCRAEVATRPVATAEILFTFQPASLFANGARDEVLERFLARTAGAAQTPGHTTPSATVPADTAEATPPPPGA